MFDLSKPKKGCSSSITIEMNPFEFLQCSKNNVRVRSMFDKMLLSSKSSDKVTEN